MNTWCIMYSLHLQLYTNFITLFVAPHMGLSEVLDICTLLARSLRQFVHSNSVSSFVALPNEPL